MTEPTEEEFQKAKVESDAKHQDALRRIRAGEIVRCEVCGGCGHYHPRRGVEKECPVCDGTGYRNPNQGVRR